MLKIFLLLSIIFSSMFAETSTINSSTSVDINTTKTVLKQKAIDIKGGYTKGLNRPEVGLYITSLDNFDTKNGSFDIIFWSWFIYDASKNYKAENTTELTNAKDMSILQTLNIKVPKNKIWNSQKVKATISHNWDFSKYPFDTQKLTIKFEDGDYDYRDLRFITDTHGSKISQELDINGWNIKSFTLKEHKHIIESNFGDPSLSDDQSVYSQVVATIEIERHWLREFINNFGAIYIAFFILALSYMFKDAYSEKLSLFLTSIFLLIGNKAIIDDRMPLTNVVTLVDKIQLFTFIIASLFITILVITITLDATGNKKLEYKINHISMYTIIPFYIIMNIYFIMSAIN